MNAIKFPKLRLVFAGMFAFVWWFLFYPELCFSEDTCEVVYQGKIYDSEEIYEQLLQADEEQIIVKSRLLDFLKQSKN